MSAVEPALAAVSAIVAAFVKLATKLASDLASRVPEIDPTSKALAASHVSAGFVREDYNHTACTHHHEQHGCHPEPSWLAHCSGSTLRQ